MGFVFPCDSLEVPTLRLQLLFLSLKCRNITLEIRKCCQPRMPRHQQHLSKVTAAQVQSSFNIPPGGREQKAGQDQLKSLSLSRISVFGSRRAAACPRSVSTSAQRKKPCWEPESGNLAVVLWELSAGVLIWEGAEKGKEMQLETAHEPGCAHPLCGKACPVPCTSGP